VHLSRRVAGELTCGLLLAFSVSACATEYSAAPITAKVVDSSSGTPLEGVHVVAHWQLEEPQSGRSQGDLELMEAVTDTNGDFHFPAWGPKAVPGSKFPGTRLTNQDPAILFFKSGYWPKAVINDTHSTMHREPQDAGPSTRNSQWDGKTITLTKFDGAVEVYSTALSSLLGTVSYGDCWWKKIPRTIVALNQEADRLNKQRVFTNVPTIRHLENVSVGKNCGPVQEFLEEHSR
jgi:hypothetical protein